LVGDYPEGGRYCLREADVYLSLGIWSRQWTLLDPSAWSCRHDRCVHEHTDRVLSSVLCPRRWSRRQGPARNL